MTLIKSFLVILLMTCCIVSCQYAEKVDYIFPDHFRGYAIVVFSSKNGPQVNYVNGRAQLEIPSNGILFTSMKRPVGILDNQYFIKNASGGKDKIYSSVVEIPRIDTLSPYLLAESYQSIQFRDEDSSLETQKEKWHVFEELIIFKIANGFKDTTASQRELDKYFNSIKPILKTARQ